MANTVTCSLAPSTLVSVGNVLSDREDEEELARLHARDGVIAFRYGEMEMGAWPVLPLEDDADLYEVLSEARRSYEAVGS